MDGHPQAIFLCSLSCLLKPWLQGACLSLEGALGCHLILSHHHTANSSVYLSRLQHLSKSLEVEEDVYSQNKTWWRRAAVISESHCCVKSPVSPCTAWDWGLMFLHIVTHLLKSLFLHMQKWIAAPAFRAVLGVRAGIKLKLPGCPHVEQGLSLPFFCSTSWTDQNTFYLASL